MWGGGVQNQSGGKAPAEVALAPPRMWVRGGVTALVPVRPLVLTALLCGPIH